MRIKRRTRRKIVAVSLVLLVAFVVTMAGADAFGFRSGRYTWPWPLSVFIRG